MAAVLQVAFTQSPTALFPTSLDTRNSLIDSTYTLYTQLATSITESSTTITVNDSSGFGDTYQLLLIDSEKIFYTDRIGNVLVASRAARQVLRRPHSAGAIVSSYPKPVGRLALADAILAIETKLGIGATIDPLKIGAGNVNSTKFGYLANLTSDVQTQLNTIPTTSLYNALTLQNSWASASTNTWGTPSYSKMGNLVCWQGLLVNGSNATVVFTLPAAARPNADTILTTSSERGWARFNIVSSTGAVTVNNWSGSVLSLSGVCYVVP
jgi:hypothetical protein